MDEVKKCRFCGSSPKLFITEEGAYYCCEKCGRVVGGIVIDDDGRRASINWNKNN